MKLGVVSLMTGVPWGGSEELWAAAAREALGRGWPVEGMLPEWPAVPEKVQSLVDRGMILKRWPKFDPKLTARIANKLRGNTLIGLVQKSDVDALMISLGSAWDIAGYPQLCDHLRSTKRPYVLVVQHNHETPLQAWTRERIDGVFEKAASVVFVSERNRRSAERQLASPIPNAIVLQNPVNLASFDRVPYHAPSNESVSQPACGFAALACVARLEVRAKGQDVLFEALAAPEWKPCEWRLTLIGEGPDREYLAKLAAMYGIADRVIFAGQQRDMRAAWAGQELLVLPSRSEGTPLALVEAQIAGRPAVVTDVGDSARWVAEGETGFVADAATAASFGKALNRAWDRRAEWAAMGDLAHERTAVRIDRTPGVTLLEHLQSVVR
jgi:glycosyltransferase involved in cell wall biosynthesis